MLQALRLLELYQKVVLVWVGDIMGVHLYKNGAWTDSGKIYRNSLNLFPDTPSSSNASINQNTGEEIANNEFNIYTIPVTGETKYTINFLFASGTSTRKASVHQYNGDAWISALVVIDNVLFPQTVTTAANATKIKISVLKDTSNRCCNVGETAFPYEPYNIVDWYTNTGHGYSSGAWS